MIQYFPEGAWLLPKDVLLPNTHENQSQISATLGNVDPASGRSKTIAHEIFRQHNTADQMQELRLKFDALASHDITFVGIIQTARASGLTAFPLPYVLTNCHNSLCAVGGTINEDDHLFGLSAARKYGGIYVPPHLAVIHQYMREEMAGCGAMILGSDSHTRYGAYGTLAIGEGGGELAKQLLGQTYDIPYPQVVAVELAGRPKPGVGPQDVALVLIGAVFAKGLVKNKVLEFLGEGIAALDMDYRNGIDVMTTETTCLSSIWRTDSVTKDYLTCHGRPEAYRELAPQKGAYYDALIRIDLSQVEPMIALPMHPSNVYTIRELQANLTDILYKTEQDCLALLGHPDVTFSLRDKVRQGRLQTDQGVIAGCAGGTYANITAAAQILAGQATGQGAYSLSVYPSSQPVMMALTAGGSIGRLMAAGAVVRSAFCGPCFGAGDVPANNTLSIRHTTRNFPSREGSKPGNGQIAAVALMDARSIAATSLNQGLLTAATEIDYDATVPPYHYDNASYHSRVYRGFGQPLPEETLRMGPGIADWPAMPALPENLLLSIVSIITDPVTTTDELIPSGETSSYRSNPLGLAEFTLSRKDPAYVGKAKAVQILEKARARLTAQHGAAQSAAVQGSAAQDNVALRGETQSDGLSPAAELARLLALLQKIPGQAKLAWSDVGIASALYARKPGDGSAREQAASCQRVLGGGANIAAEYATKRYRSNLINWGMLPFHYEGEPPFQRDSYLLIPDMRRRLQAASPGQPLTVTAWLLDNSPRSLELTIAPLTREEIQILLAGCLINANRLAANNA